RTRCGRELWTSRHLVEGDDLEHRFLKLRALVGSSRDAGEMVMTFGLGRNGCRLCGPFGSQDLRIDRPVFVPSEQEPPQRGFLNILAAGPPEDRLVSGPGQGDVQEAQVLS